MTIYNKILFVMVLISLISCGSTPSNTYIQQWVTEQSLTATAIYDLPSSNKIVFVDSPTEKGCVLVWGQDGNMGYNRVTNETYATSLDPSVPVIIYQTLITGVIRHTHITCILVQDVQLQHNTASIKVQYASKEVHKKVTPGQSHYLVIDTATEIKSVDRVLFLDKDGNVLHTYSYDSVSN